MLLSALKLESDFWLRMSHSAPIGGAVSFFDKRSCVYIKLGLADTTTKMFIDFRVRLDMFKARYKNAFGYLSAVLEIHVVP